jgi:hypothetical protein
VVQEKEIDCSGPKPFGKKEKTGIGVTQVQPKMARTPFSNSLNYLSHAKKGSVSKEVPVKREVRLKKKEEKRRQ